jgi:hypothetical protein
VVSFEVEIVFINMIYIILRSTLEKVQEAAMFFCLPDCWLAVGMHAHCFDTVSLRFLCLESKC